MSKKCAKSYLGITQNVLILWILFRNLFFFFFGLQSVQSYNVVVINTYCISSVGTNEKFDLNSVVTLSCLKTLESIVLIVYKTKFCYLLYFQNFFLFFRKILSPFCFLIFVNICFSSVFFPKRLFWGKRGTYQAYSTTDTVFFNTNFNAQWANYIYTYIFWSVNIW